MTPERSLTQRIAAERKIEGEEGAAPESSGASQLPPCATRFWRSRTRRFRPQPGEMVADLYHLEVYQTVTLDSGRGARAATWSVGGAGIGDLKPFRDAVRDRVDQFINNWLSVNPK